MLRAALLLSTVSGSAALTRGGVGARPGLSHASTARRAAASGGLAASSSSSSSSSPPPPPSPLPELCVFDLDACLWDKEMFEMTAVPEEGDAVLGPLGEVGGRSIKTTAHQNSTHPGGSPRLAWCAPKPYGRARARSRHRTPPLASRPSHCSPRRGVTVDRIRAVVPRWCFPRRPSSESPHDSSAGQPPVCHTLMRGGR